MKAAGAHGWHLKRTGCLPQKPGRFPLTGPCNVNMDAPKGELRQHKSGKHLPRLRRCLSDGLRGKHEHPRAPEALEPVVPWEGGGKSKALTDRPADAGS